MRLTILTLLAYCSVASAIDTAPPPRAIPQSGGVPSVLIPDDAGGGFAAVKLGRVSARVPQDAARVSVLIPDDDAKRAAEVAGALDPANPPLRRVFLGRVSNPNPPAAVKLSRYVAPARAPPASVDYSPKALASLKRMYLNDRYGCCVISSLYHGIGVWTGNDSAACQVVPDSTIRSVYAKWAYVPGTDSGCIISDVLDRQRDQGAPLADGTLARIDGYAVVDSTNVEQVKAWIHLFGGGPIGVDLPEAWTKGGDGSVWDVSTSRVVGGHDVRVFGYDAIGVKVSTWGGTRTITWRAFTDRSYVVEAYCPLSPQWYGDDKLAPNGVDVAGLRTALAVIKAGGVPSIDPPAPPVVDPPVPVPPGGGFTGALYYRSGALIAVVPGESPPAPHSATVLVEQLVADGRGGIYVRVVERPAGYVPQVAPTPTPLPPAHAVPFAIPLPAACPGGRCPLAW